MSSANLSPYLDRGNMHPYPGGGTPLHNLASLVPLTAKSSGTKQIVATEAGYHSDLDHRERALRHVGARDRDLHPPAGPRGLQAGPRTHLLLPARGPLGNLSGFENRFGLLRNDLSPKPAFLALRNLLRAVDADSAPVASPGGLRLGFAGAPADLRRLLLRSADGSYALVLWREVSVWDRVAQRDLLPTPAGFEVVFGEPIRLAQRYDPVESDTERQRWSDARTIPLVLAGAPVVLRLTPAAR